jgi:K+-transporting ATPase A subunit
MALDILQIAIVLVILMLLVRPVGTYMAAVFTHKKTVLDRVLDPVDNAIYKVSGIDPHKQQRWPAYIMVAFPYQANGSIINDKDGNPIGSELIAQAFDKDGYIHPRPSAVPTC